jgi:hypothetical protein
LRQIVPAWGIHAGRIILGLQRVSVQWHLRRVQHHRLLPTTLAYLSGSQAWPIPHVHRNAAAQIGQSEGSAAIASIRRAEQRKESRVLRDGKQLAIAKSPATRGKVEANHHDLTDERFTHCIPPLVRIESENLCRDLKQAVLSDSSSGITSFASRNQVYEADNNAPQTTT